MQRNNQVLSGKMSGGNKKIKLEIMGGELVQDGEKGGVEKREVETKEEEALIVKNIKLEPANFFLKEEMDDEQMKVDEDIEEESETRLEMSVGNQSSRDEAGSNYTMVASDHRNKRTKTLRSFICTICNYATKRPLSFTKHWLSHESQSYSNENGVYACQISDCCYVSAIEGDMIRHIAIKHIYQYSCHFCYFITYSKDDYIQHCSTHYIYQCLKCDLQSTKLLFVQDHAETPFRCTMCDFTTYHWFLLNKHTNWHSYPPDSIVECGFCDFATGDQALLAMHRVDHCTKFILCKMCKFTGKNIAEIAQHYKENHDTTLAAIDKLHKCKFCTCKFISLGYKKQHEELHLNRGASLKCCWDAKMIQCPYCDYLDKQHDGLKMHILSKHAAAFQLEGFRFENASDDVVSVFKDLKACDVEDIEEPEENQSNYEAQQEKNSGYATTYQEKTVINADIAEDEGAGENYAKNTQIIWRCRICPHVSKDKHDLNRHLTSIHKMSQTERKWKARRSLSCTMCQFTTTKRGTYESHLSTHTPLKNKIMPTKQKLESDAPKDNHDVHCEQHSTFKCTNCTFESFKKLFVEDHIENRWGCSKCDFKTHHWLPMKSHSFIHDIQTEALFKCNVCDFETRKIGVLKNHRITHTTGILRCKVCLFKASCENALQNHYAEHHYGCITPLDDMNTPSNDRPYECDLCACKFKQQAYLDKHRTLHDENEKPKANTETEDKLNSWDECPYCRYEDDARYRMIDHLSLMHQKELEIEGYRFGDAHTINSHQNPPRKAISDTPPLQMQYGTEGKEVMELRMYTKQNAIESDGVSGCTSSSRQIQYVGLPSTGFLADQEPEHVRKLSINLQNQGNEETESVQTNPIEKDDIDSAHTTTERIIITIEPTVSAEQESPTYLTPKDNMVGPNNRSTHQHQAQTQIQLVSAEQESPTYLTPKDNPVGPNNRSMHQQAQTQIQLVPDYSGIDKKWHCPACPYTVKRKHRIEQHIDNRHKEGQNIIWRCEVCFYRSKKEDNLRDHVALMHNVEYRPKVAACEEIPCKQPGCDFKAPSVDVLSVHMTRHLQTDMQELLVLAHSDIKR